MSRTWTDLADFAALQAPDIPENALEQVIKWSAIRLCERSGILKRDIIFDSQAGVGDYPLDLEDCYRPHTIYAMCVNGMNYAPQSDDLCCDNSCNKVFFLRDPTHVNIRPVPRLDEEDGIRIVLSVKPSIDSCVVDELLYEEFSETITAGALARLFKSQRKPWSNMTLAREFEKDFHAGVSRAMIRAYKGFTRGPIRLKAIPFVTRDSNLGVLSGGFQ